MDTAWPLDYHIYKLARAITACLDFNRERTLLFDEVCCISTTGLLYLNMCSIDCTQRLRNMVTIEELCCLFFHFSFSCRKTNKLGPRCSQMAPQTLLTIIETEERDTPKELAVFLIRLSLARQYNVKATCLSTSIQSNLDYPNQLGLGQNVRIIESSDNQSSDNRGWTVGCRITVEWRWIWGLIISQREKKSCSRHL